MLVQAIADFLEAQGIGTVKTADNAGNIFMGDMPDQPDTCIAVFEYAGMAPEGKAAPLDRPGLQVRVRNFSYTAARAKAQEIQNQLHNLHDQVLNGTEYLSVLANQGVTPLGRDPQGRMDFTQNYTVIKGRG